MSNLADLKKKVVQSFADNEKLEESKMVTLGNALGRHIVANVDKLLSIQDELLEELRVPVNSVPSDKYSMLLSVSADGIELNIHLIHVGILEFQMLTSPLNPPQKRAVMTVAEEFVRNHYPDYYVDKPTINGDTASLRINNETFHPSPLQRLWRWIRNS